MRWGVACVILMGTLAATGSAQTLAHKGWAGSGLTVDRWWRNATFYEVAVPTSGGLDAVTSRLDSLQALGVDALVLADLSPKDEVTQEDAFGHLQQEAARRKIRLIADLPLTSAQGAEQAAGMARFWLTRGVGGLRVRMPESAPGAIANSQGELSQIQALRRLCAGFSGDRVLLTPEITANEAEAVPVAHRGRHHAAASTAPSTAAGTAARTAPERTTDPAQLSIDESLLHMPAWRADLLQTVIASGHTGALAVSDDAQHAGTSRFGPGLTPPAHLALEKMVAAALFAGREAPLLQEGQERTEGEPETETTPPDAASLLGWYRTLSALRHTNATLRAGAMLMLDTGYPDVVAWVRRGIGVQQPVLIVCNLSTRPLVMSLVEPLKRVGLTASSGVRPLALSVTGGEQSYTASAIAVPPYGTYLGEVRQPGLEESASPVRSHRRGR